MVISKKERPSPCKLTIGTKVIKQVNGFNYLGSRITSDGRCDKDIKRRIRYAMAKLEVMLVMLVMTKDFPK